jgi:hypothetical protein
VTWHATSYRVHGAESLWSCFNSRTDAHSQEIVLLFSNPSVRYGACRRIWLSCGILRRVVWYKLTDVSDLLIASETSASFYHSTRSNVPEVSSYRLENLKCHRALTFPFSELMNPFYRMPERSGTIWNWTEEVCRSITADMLLGCQDSTKFRLLTYFEVGGGHLEQMLEIKYFPYGSRLFGYLYITISWVFKLCFNIILPSTHRFRPFMFSG